MKELEITKGEVEIDRYGNLLKKGNKALMDTVPVYGVCISNTKESEANRDLLFDAITTSNQCNLLPSELLKQNEALKNALKDVRKWYERNHEQYLGEYTPTCFSKALEAINQTK